MTYNNDTAIGTWLKRELGRKTEIINILNLCLKVLSNFSKEIKSYKKKFRVKR